MTNQTKTNNLNYLIDPYINSSFKNEEGRTSLSKYYTLKVKNEDFNIWIDEKSFSRCASKEQGRSIRKNIRISKNNDYITGNLLNYEYLSNIMNWLH